MLHAHCKVVRDAIDVVLRNAGALPPSREREEVYAKLRDCALETDVWDILPPTARDMEALSKRLLAVHVAVRKLAA
jgi:hypothetical protein